MNTSESNVELIQQIYYLFTVGDVAGLLATLSPSVKWCIPEMPHVPFAGCRFGREAVQQFFTELLAEQESLGFSLERVLADDEKAIGLGNYQWRVRSTGREFHLEWAHVFTIVEGQVSCFQEYFDTQIVIAAYQPSRTDNLDG